MLLISWVQHFRIVPEGFFASLAAGLLLSLFSIESLQAQLPVFPGAVGFGVDTQAGRGGRVIRVTNLSDSGAGSLREAAQASGPRVVIFDVSGTIYLQQDIVIREPFVTIAGQTAPTPGITLAHAGLRVKSHDVLVQHLRVRPGDLSDGPDKENRDALAMTGDSQGNIGVFNVVIDHCSFSWGTDENVSTWYRNVYDLTIINSIVSEALMNAGHPSGSHSMGYLMGDHTQNTAMINNLFAHNENRNPLVKGDVTAFIANNIIYDFANEPIVFGDLEGVGPSSATVIGNDIIPGPATRRDYAVRVYDTTTEGTRIYLDDNKFPGRTNDPWSVAEVSVSFNVKADTAPVNLPEAMNILPADELESVLLPHVGARPVDRDAVDSRIIDDVVNRTGSLIDSQQQVGGWPDEAGNRRVLDLPENPDDDDNGDGYTNLEQWLHELSAEVEGRRPSQPAEVRITGASVRENDTTADVLISLNRALDSDVEVLAYTVPKTAVNGTDFYGFAKRVKFAAGTVSQTVSVQIIDDDEVERYEYFNVNIHVSDNDSLRIAKRVAQINVFNDD